MFQKSKRRQCRLPNKDSKSIVKIPKIKEDMMIGRETQLYISATVDPVKQIDLSIGTSYRL